MRAILAVDPGKMTGFAVYVIQPFSPAADFTAGELPMWDFVDMVEPIIQSYGELLVVCERFVITGGTTKMSRTDENWSIEQIGILRHLCRRHGRLFELQGAADAKRFAGNDRLKKIGWHQRGGGGHHNDALRHLLLALARHEPERLPAGVVPS